MATAEDCALALAHLYLPSLTSLCILIVSDFPNSSVVQELLPYVTQHAHGPQDIQPFRSVLLHKGDDYTEILAWPVPDIDLEVHNPPSLLAAILPPRLEVSFVGDRWTSSNARLELLDSVMAGLPLDDLVTLVAQDLGGYKHNPRDFSTQQFWSHVSPKWPLLQRVRLGPPVERGFIEMC